MYAQDIFIMTMKTILWAIPIGLLIMIVFPIKK